MQPKSRLVSLALGLAACLMIGGSSAPSLALSSLPPAEERGLDIIYVDVLGGAATLIVTPAGETILVDSGWPGRDDRDPKRIVHALREVAGRERIDHLVTTHWHTDHYGGVEGLSKLVEIGTYWDRGLPEDGIAGLDFPDGPKPDDPLYLAYKAASEGKRRVLSAGDRFDMDGGVTVDVVASGGHVKPGDGGEPNEQCDNAPDDLPEDRSDNGRSVAFVLSLGKFRFFDGGDLTWNFEKQLVCPRDLIGPIDLYQVTHHGLDVSNHPTLLKTIQPTVSIMNNGPRKGGTPATVRLLKSIPSIEAAYQLHRNVRSGPEDNTDPELIANSDEEGGRFIHVHVEPDGSSYTVRIGADGEPRQFKSR